MRTIVIFPGRFQPAHTGHKSVYDYLTQKYGIDNVYISSTDVTDNIKSPFNFKDKKIMLTAIGIPENKIIQVKNNYNIDALDGKIPNFNKNTDILLFAVSLKDMQDDPRFKGFKKKDGSLTYIQPSPIDLTAVGLPSGMETADKHAYLIPVPTIRFSVLGKPMNSASSLRKMYATADTNTRKKIIADLYGKVDNNIFMLMNSKLTPANKKTQLKEELRKFINQIITEDFKRRKAATIKAKDALVKQKEVEKKDYEDAYKVTKKTALASINLPADKKKESDDKVKNANAAAKSAKTSLEAAKKDKSAAQKL
jgi:hypothetical protein